MTSRPSPLSRSDGGSITAYGSLGNPVNVQFRWTETSAGSWQLFYQSNSNATGTQAAWQNVGTVFNFNSTGQLSAALTSVTLQNLTVNGDNLGNVQLNFGTGGLTQYANSSGTAQVSQLQQNGFAAGQLQSVAVDSQNRITGTFSQRPDHSARRNHARHVQRSGLVAGHQWRRLRGDGRLRPADLWGDRHGRGQLAGSVERRHRDPVQSSDRGAAGLF